MYKTQTDPADRIPWEPVRLEFVRLLDLSAPCVSRGGGEDRALCVGVGWGWGRLFSHL